VPMMKRVLCQRGCAKFRSSSVGSISAWFGIGTSAAFRIQPWRLYLFLVTVADAQGLSYYGDPAISQLLSLDAATLIRARQELLAAKLIAYQRPLYQVLSLDAPRSEHSEPVLLGDILRGMAEKKQ